MNRKFRFLAILMMLLAAFVFTGCDGNAADGLFDGDDGGDGPTPPPAPTPVTYTVSFYANGGTGTMDDAIVEKGVAYTVPTNGFAAPKIPVGAVNGDADIPFAGWNTKKDGSGTAYAAGAAIPAVTADITLYAQWSKPSFSVSSTRKVYFAKGNLKYDGSAGTWDFYNKQYERASGYDANLISLFTWGYEATKSIVPDGQESDNVSRTSGNLEQTEDWGCTIGDGSTWRTLTKDEWTYLFNTSGSTENYRQDANRFAKAKVNNVNGLLIFPDGYNGGTTISGITGVAAVNDNMAGFPDTSIDDDTWTAMENAGVVFLPAAGYRGGSNVNGVDDYGNYWSATALDSNSAYSLYFGDSVVNPADNGNRDYGYSVRLVVAEN